MEGYMSELWDFTRISVTQNDLQDLKEIWDQWNDEMKQLFYNNYGDLPYLLDIKVDKHLFRSLTQYWNLAYSCFTFGKVDLVPTVEEYTTLLRCPKVQVDNAYSRAANVPTFLKKLMNITGMNARQRVDVFTFSIYGLVVFPKALGHVDEAVSDLFDRLDKRVTPIPAILAETFRSFSACRKAGEGRFIECAQLLLGWFHSHFWKVEKVSYWVFSKNYSPLKELVATPRRDDISEEKWILIFQNLQEEDVEWRALWMIPNKILYRCGDFYWVVHLELEIIKQDFEKRSSKLGKRIEQLEEEKMRLGLDVDIYKLEVEKLRKEKNKAEEDLDSLKMDYKKDARARENALERSLLEGRNEIARLKARVAELEKSLHLYRSRNSTIELRASLSKIEELKGRIGELEDAF
ncbi:hypothetical protein Goshw_015266 [Gossypium schwendimanii]|uniref:DUF7745 domain-containing protein n=1 Tax=Gossypium schwendimanii TaxID=34291 RepID=A0A7J9NFB0_GOSSC|nr:hypothetical protein [Gossypium schwendimanii]